MSMDFHSVDKFLEAARKAKDEDRSRIEDVLASTLDDPHAFSVPPSLAKEIGKLVEDYQDEALKNIAMYCLGMWHQEHQAALTANLEKGDGEAALFVMSDTAQLSMLMRCIADIGTFHGQEEYREMIHKELSQAVIEMLEEEGKPLSSFGAES